MNTTIISQSDATIEMSSAWKRMMAASTRMASVQGVWRDYNHRGIEIPETWGDFETVWTEFQAAREEDVNATDAYRRACRKAGYIGVNSRTRCPHLR
jgi:outer membrane protease